VQHRGWGGRRKRAHVCVGSGELVANVARSTLGLEESTVQSEVISRGRSRQLGS
jgi:hypothetical protein